MTATPRAVELIEIAATAAADKLATDIIAYDVSDQLVITDAFLLCSAANDRQVRSIVDEIELRLSQAGAKPIRREGERDGRWVLLDYVDIVVHVQHAGGGSTTRWSASGRTAPSSACPSPSPRAPGASASRGIWARRTGTSAERPAPGHPSGAVAARADRVEL